LVIREAEDSGMVKKDVGREYHKNKLAGIKYKSPLVTKKRGVPLKNKL
jgi:hypothetical protein